MTDIKIDEIIKTKAELAFYYENLAYAVDSSEGQKIIIELKSVLNDLQNELVGISIQDLPAPYYEFDKTDLQRMKALRAKKEILSSIVGGFDSQVLLAASKRLKDEIDLLKKGEPAEASY